MRRPTGGIDRSLSGIGTVTALNVVPRPLSAAEKRRRFLSSVATHSMLIVASLMFVLPMVFVITTSLMTDRQSLTREIWPRPFQWGNYADVFDRIDLLRYTVNTTLIATLSTVGVVVSCIPVAYALSRMQWRGRQAMFILVLATLMLPFQVTVVPLYVIFVRLHWINTLLPLIVPSFFGDAFSIFLLRQFFLTIPDELSDAARVDGASEFQIMTRVVVPLAKPAIAAVALFNFLYNWNDFFGPLLYLVGNRNVWTLGLALSEFRTLHHVEWNLTMSASMLFMVPVIVLFFLAQRVFVEGVTLTGVKG
jgi:multiple sugar transport system permease protein